MLRVGKALDVLQARTRGSDSNAGEGARWIVGSNVRALAAVRGRASRSEVDPERITRSAPLWSQVSVQNNGQGR